MFNWNWDVKSTTPVVVKKDYRVYPATICNSAGPYTAGWAVEEYDGTCWRRTCVFDTIDQAQQAIEFLIKQGK